MRRLRKLNVIARDLQIEFKQIPVTLILPASPFKRVFKGYWFVE